MKTRMLLGLAICLLYMGSLRAQQNPDNVYPVPFNNIVQKYHAINLFTGQVNDTFTLVEIKGRTLTYRLQAFYNSATAGVIASNKGKFVSNALGGYGWKMMDYPKIVQDGSNYYLLDGYAAYPLQQLTNTWAGGYSTGMKWGGASGKWNGTGNLVITDTGTVYFGADLIPDPVFTTNKITWNWPGHSQATLNLQTGCNNNYFYNPPVAGKCFTGAYQSGSDGWVDFRGQMQGSMINTQSYSPGGKYYLWQVQKITNGSNVTWEIATEDGTHYSFDQAGLNIGSNITAWSFSKMREALWNDAIYFTYGTDGNLNKITTLTQDTFIFTYNTVSGKKLLSTIAHSSAGMKHHTRSILYQSLSIGGTAYNVLSGFKTITQINSKVSAENRTGYVFNYYTGTAGNRGLLSSIITPEGGINTYTYQPVKGRYCAVQLAINDGYANYSGDTLDANTYSAIEYDTTNLLNDVTNTYTQINYAEIFPGGRYRPGNTLLKHPYGSLEYYFYNGKTAANLWDVPKGLDTAAATSTTLRGYLYQNLVNSDSLVSDKTREEQAHVNYWSVGYIDTIAGKIVSFPKLDKTYSQEYHLGSWTTYGYGTRYSLVKNIYTTRRNPKPLSEGFNKDSLKTHLMYAFEKYPALRADSIRMLNVPAQTTQFVQEDLTGPFKVTDCGCTQWSMWDKSGNPVSNGVTWAPWKIVTMRDSTAMHDSCFTSGASGTTRQWLVKNVTSRRTPWGAVSDSLSANRAAGSALYTTPEFGILPVANFTNAAVDSTNTGIVPYAAYLGFEPYEKNNQQKWQITGQGAVWGNAHTGEYALSGDANITMYLKLNAARKFILSGWCRVGQSGDSGVFRLYDGSGRILASKSVIAGMGNPVWTYVEVTATLQPGQFVKATVHTAGGAFIDDVRISPIDAPFKGYVYDLMLRQLVAEMGDNGETDYYVYNKFGSPIAAAGPSSTRQIKMLSVPYNSRGGNKIINNTDAFDPVYPNMELKVGAVKGGNWESFQLKSSEFFPVKGMSNMSIVDGSLVTTAVPASAQYAPDIDSVNFLVYCDIIPVNMAAKDEMGISLIIDSFDYTGNFIGSFKLQLLAQTDSIKLLVGGVVRKATPIKNFPASTSLLLSVMEGNNVSAYLFGRYLFEYTFATCKIRNSITLTSTNLSGGFDNFVQVNVPDLDQQTLDALSRPKQYLERKSATQLQVSEIMYGGPMNLPLAQTRPGLLGGTGGDVGLSYKPGFASGFRSDSLDFDSTSTLANAAGYDNPFDVTVQFNQTPIMQIGSVGGGGAFSVKDTGGNYTTFNYGDPVSSVFNYTSTELLMNTKSEMDGSRTISFVNKEKVEFGKAIIQRGDTSRMQWEYDKAMRLSRKYLPNFYKANLSGNNKFYEEYGYDFTGNMISITTPDAGTAQMVYDLSGNPRFMMYASGALSNPDTIVYRKYDLLNRVIEEGYFIGNWNRDTLQLRADNNRFYPQTGDASTIIWRKKYNYDGNGIAPDKGKLTSVYVNWNRDTLAEVTERFAYNAAGFVSSKGLQVKDFDTITRYVNYAYDDFGRVTQISFPGTSQKPVTYSYNGKGQVSGIGIPGSGNYYASYQYEFNTIEYLNNNSYMRTYAYNETGWPVQINDPLFSETLAYNSADGDSLNYYNGRIASQTLAQKWNGNNTNGSFVYDNYGRLITANYGFGNPMNLGVTNPVSYDPNGNIQNLQNGTGSNMVLNYNNGTNKLQTVQGFSATFVYDANGNIISVPYGAKTIAYDPVSQMTTGISIKNTNVSFEYNGKDQRVLKTAVASGKTTRRLYIHGLNDYPLMEIGQDASGKRTTTFYVYGPTGLIAIQQGERRLFTLKDHLGSVRAVIDSNNQLRASFTYTALGVTSSSIDSTIIDIPLNYRFTGQEYDPETGLYNFRARFYDPGYGRFYAPDPLVQYASPYVYAGNNPVSNIDPSGTWSIWSTIVTAAVAVVVTAAVIVAAPVVLPAAIAASAAATALTAVVAGTAAATITGGIAGAVGGDGFVEGMKKGAVIGAVASVATAGIALASGAVAAPMAGYQAAATQGASYLARIGMLTRGGALTIMGKYMVGSMVAGVVAGTSTGALLPNNPTPVNVTDYPRPYIDVKSLPSELDIPGYMRVPTGIKGFRAGFLIDSATFLVPNEQGVERCKSSPYTDPQCPGGKPNQNYCDGKQPYSSPLFTLQDWNTKVESRLKINANFFSIWNISSPNLRCYPCTKIMGVSVSNYQMISSPITKDITGCTDITCSSTCGNLMDAFLVLADPNNPKTKQVKIVKNDSIQYYLNTGKVQSAVAGGVIVRNGKVVDSADMNPSIKPNGIGSRTVIGISKDGRTVYFVVVQVGPGRTSPPSGVNAKDIATYMRYVLKCDNAINLDNSGSSQFIFNEGNSVKYITIVGDIEGYRPIPNFIGVK
jgi:RHS repeat-associated protein